MPHPKPYSFSRWQLVWWTFIIFASFISVIIASGKIPTFDNSTLILLGIGSITTIAATLIDISDNDNAANTANANATQTVVVSPPPAAPADPNAPVTAAPEAAPVVTVVNTPAPQPVLAQSINHNSFFLDILSDRYGINIHRLQAFVFNVVFGVWFIYTTVMHIKNITIASAQPAIDAVIPVITNNNLILLGMSAGIYTTLKTTENKQ
ncbi:hypothetical protein KXQ82_08900 [Mucilaginibacter sp. HMF5004]|uniref:hypothetical protein n=1 Tax=Mucilaginibacter rivuli TaxID=2857527 RepID=UPI001C5E7215|nr:hypothetical protein [Mucilaginibacter rivuli]MBW4889832.1 hypothetical protein [Mucilaginibacter rivuli]